MLTSIPVRTLFDVPIHAATMPQVIRACDEAIRARRPLRIAMVNAAKIVTMCRDPALHEAVVSSDLTLADGMSVVWAGRLLRQRLPERVAGIDLFQNLLSLADERAYSVYFLGATQGTLEAVVRRVRELHPRARIAGSHHGYFTDAEAPAVAEEIRGSGADMLFVAISPPKKELFLARWGDTLGVPVQHGVGGSFDVLAGRVVRAPRWMQQSGLEWLYRLVQEPRRMWKRYLVTNTLFLAMLCWEFLRRRQDRRALDHVQKG